MPTPAIVHRYAFSFREAIAALLQEDQVDADTIEVRVVGNALVVDIVNPAPAAAPEQLALKPIDAGGPAPADEPEAGAPAAAEEPIAVGEEVAPPPPAPEQPPAEPEPARRKGGPLATRAGIICNEPAFAVFMDASSLKEATEALRLQCGVASRADLDHDEAAGRKFKDIEADYKAWLRADGV